MNQWQGGKLVNLDPDAAGDVDRPAILWKGGIFGQPRMPFSKDQGVFGKRHWSLPPGQQADHGQDPLWQRNGLGAIGDLTAPTLMVLALLGVGALYLVSRS